MMNVHEILEKARAAGHRLPYNEAAVLFAAAVRLAAAHGSTLRGRLVQIDEAGGLHVEAFDEHAPEAEPGYLAPELLAADAPPALSGTSCLPASWLRRRGKPRGRSCRGRLETSSASPWRRTGVRVSAT